MIQSKACARCREYLALTSFGCDRRNKDGLAIYCKLCCRTRRQGLDVGAVHRAPNSVRDATGKTCPRCRDHKPWSRYAVHRGAKDGHQSYCRDCAYALERESDARNAEVIRARHAEKLARQADPTKTKVCRKCGKEKSQIAFYAHRSTSDGRANYCCDCAAEYQRNWRAKNREKVRGYNRSRDAEPRRRQRSRELTRLWRLRLYDLTPPDYDLLLSTQGGGCAICGEPGKGWAERDLCIDHDHSSKAVRGLLCNGCNLGLGKFKDDVQLLSRAISYLSDPPAMRNPPAVAG